MTARRTQLGRLALACAAVAALTGCEKPAPIVTVFSGAQSEWKEADVYCFEGQSLEAGECVQRAEGETSIEVVPSERIGIDVSKDVAERGWYWELRLGEQSQQSEVLREEHYTTLFAPNVGSQTLQLVVRTLGEDGEEGAPTGEWVFQLVPEGADEEPGQGSEGA